MEPIFKSKQEVLDHVRTNLLKQGKKSVSDTTTACAYRSSDGSKCAIGWCIPDELYDPRMDAAPDGMEVSDLHRQFPQVYAAVFGDMEVDFLTDLQKIHDFSLPSDWEFKLQNLAYRYNLDGANDE